MQTHLIEFSTNEQWLGKPSKMLDENGVVMLNKNHQPIYEYKGNKVYIGYNWLNTECTYPELFNFLTKTGGSIAPLLIEDAEGNLKNEHFYSHQLLLVDIDDGMTIEQLQKNELYQDFGSGFYTTANHTQDAQRFRILFLLEAPITSAENMCMLYAWFIDYYKSADPSCKNACRLFYGTINAARSELTDRFLPDYFINNALQEQKLKIEEIECKKREYVISQAALYPSNITSTNDMSIEKKARILELLLTVPPQGHGSHGSFIALAMALKVGGYSLDEFIDVTNKLYSHKVDLCPSIWSITTKADSHIGIIIKLIKTHYGNYCLSGY